MPSVARDTTGSLLIDRHLPRWHFREYHQAHAAAYPETAYQALRSLDASRSPFIGPLLRLRELPFRLLNRDFESKGFGHTLSDLLQLGFLDLGQEPPREFALGLVGRFWTLFPELVSLEPGQFAGFLEEGYAKVATNFLVTPQGPDSCLLSTETRILCLGPKALGRFRRYWIMIRPFSGLIRREWLRLAVRQAETRRSLP